MIDLTEKLVGDAKLPSENDGEHAKVNRRIACKAGSGSTKTG